MTTQNFTLSATAWTDLGPTPLSLHVLGSFPAAFVVDTVPPAALTAPSDVLTADAGTLSLHAAGLP